MQLAAELRLLKIDDPRSDMNQATANLAGIDIAIVVAYFLLIF